MLIYFMAIGNIWPTFGKFLDHFVIHLVHFFLLWYYVPKKSGNPAHNPVINLDKKVWATFWALFFHNRIWPLWTWVADFFLSPKNKGSGRLINYPAACYYVCLHAFPHFPHPLASETEDRWTKNRQPLKPKIWMVTNLVIPESEGRGWGKCGNKYPTKSYKNIVLQLFVITSIS
jgi:hypothetical protein